MIYSIENKDFSLAVKEMGAELNSFKSKKTGFEFIWDGNTEYWYGQSPILFPIIGRLLDDKYRLDGKEYTMPKHGIVRKKPFKLIEQTEDSLKFVQSDDAESLESYPYHFDLVVEFKITENGLSVTHTVVNKNDTVMYYSFGAHPAFNCEIGDYLEFSENEELLTERIDHESILIEEKFPVELDGKKLIITENLFNDDALILSGYNSKAVSLKSNNHNRVVKFNFDSPLLGIWAKPGAPYVCIEPWWGVNDNYDKKDDLSQKRGIMALNPNEEKSFNWNIEICE
ncbi:MAG: aldose 1-epimerase family protein [Clostridia bacterium]|nr:aldose 1-epimerase family protein [Clostridia bacterium]